MNDRRTEDLRVATFLAIALWLSFAFIGSGYEVIKNNPLPRLSLIYSIIFEHSIRIDSYAPLCVDKSFFAGHFYSDKAPGLSLMGLPFVAMLAPLARFAGIVAVPLQDGQLTTFALLAGHVANMATNGIVVALTVAVMYLTACRLGLSQQAALIGSLCYGAASPAFGWATMFVGHAMAGSCLFLAFALIMATDPTAHPTRRLLLRGSAIGGLLAWGCVVEYTTGLAAIIIGLFGIWRLRAVPRGAAIAVVGGVTLGTAAALVPLLVYDRIAFGNAFHIGYEYVVGWEPMKQGTMGLSFPRPWVAWELIFGSYRGLLWLSPVLAALPLAWHAAWRTLPRDSVVVIVAIPVVYLLINAGYFDWSGSASTGPRHLVSSLAFVGFAFGPLWDRLHARLVRGVLLAFLLVSIGISLVCAVVTMGAPNTHSESLLAWILGQFIAGNIHNVLEFILHGVPGWVNSGAWRLTTLLVLPALWLLAFVLARWAVRHPVTGPLAREGRVVT